MSRKMPLILGKVAKDENNAKCKPLFCKPAYNEPLKQKEVELPSTCRLSNTLFTASIYKSATDVNNP